MLSKENLLSEITQAAQSRIVSKKEVNKAYDDGTKKSQVNLATILSYIGGTIIFIGITIYFGQQWQTLGDIMKIIISLGAGALLYISGLFFFNDARSRVASFGIFIASFLLIPFGLYVVLNVYGVASEPSLLYMVLPALLSSILAVATAYMLKHNFFLTVSIIYLTWLYYAIISWLTNGSNLGRAFYSYMALIQAMIYISVGYMFNTQHDKKSLQGFLYGFGSLIALGSTFSLATDSNIWLWLYPAVIFAAIYGSVKLNSHAFLVFGTLSLIVYITYITSRFFAQSIGWPIALIFIGIAIIVISVSSIQINKKFLSKTPN